MKANKFVKKYGLERSKAASKMHIADFCRCFDLPASFLTDMREDLKRLVESYELVESYGGLPQSRTVAHKNCFDYPMRLLQAIVDVESCM